MPSETRINTDYSSLAVHRDLKSGGSFPGAETQANVSGVDASVLNRT